MKNSGWLILFIFPFLLISQFNNRLNAQDIDSKKENTKNLYELTLEELMNIEITTASNTSEKLTKAPATIIVITEQDIFERGYTEFYEVLNDLPGFDYSRAFGDEEYYLYTRGYRKTLSDQMLFMIDGMVVNFLWSNNMLAFAQYPLSNIKQIEVVYGPASAVYGTNAFTGVINIITKKESKSTVVQSIGENNTYITDLNVNSQLENYSLSFTGRIFSSDGYDLGDRNPSISKSIYKNPNMWGPFVNTEFSGYGSKRYDYYLKGDISYQNLSLGFINWFYESGYGTEFAATKVLNKAVWQFAENMIYAKYEKSINSQMNSKTTIKYRVSEAPPTSSFIERYHIGPYFVVDYSYWAQKSSSISFNQDFSWEINSNWFMNFGFKYENKLLQKQYLINYGPSIKGDSVLVYPVTKIPIPVSEIDQNNHYKSEDKGVYIQTKYTPSEKVDLIFGLRYDHNNIYKEVFSPRVGVVYEIERGLITKLFYGSAFLEPTARSLYGGWSGGVSNTNLKPEKMRTYEFSLNYTKEQYSGGINFYFNQGFDAIGRVNNVNTNIGERRIIGGEFYSKLIFNDIAPYLEKLKLDFYLSYTDSKEDLQKSGNFAKTGNIAPIKIHSIITAYATKDVLFSLQSRYIDEIETVSSNPVRKIKSWFVNDLYITYKNIFWNGFTMGIKVFNIFDTKYDHPGYADASAGIASDAQGNFVDDPNGGWYTSLLPQPGREIRLNFRLDF